MGDETIDVTTLSRMQLRHLTVVAGIATTVLIAAPAEAGPAVRDCHVYADYPNVLISSARHVSCRRAARDMRRYKGQIEARFVTPGEFRCRRVSGVPERGQWRCRRGRKAYRFEFRD